MEHKQSEDSGAYGVRDIGGTANEAGALVSDLVPKSYTYAAPPPRAQQQHARQ